MSNTLSILSRAFKALAPIGAEIIDLMASGASDEEIQERITKPDGLLRSAIKDIRGTKSDLEDYIRNG